MNPIWTLICSWLENHF